MLEDAYRGERAMPAIQCVIGQKPRCIFDYRDEAFPYSLEHTLDRLVGQQTVLPYRYIHPLCPFLFQFPRAGVPIYWPSSCPYSPKCLEEVSVLKNSFVSFSDLRSGA